jgi:Ig-like domain from next to BRCA1 gene
MNARNYRWIMMFPLAFLIMIACNFFTPSATSTPGDIDALYTQAAATLGAQLTQSALGATATTFPQPGQLPTATALPSQVVPPPATVTPLPTATRQPPAATSVPATRVPPPCLAARFVKDISVPDGTKFSPGVSFTKTWELENVGSCTWNEDYQLIFVKGDQMSGDDDIPIGDTVAPGETIRLSVDLVAPLDEGEYRGDWMLEDDEGDDFGIGAGAGKSFWVSIDVNQPNDGVIFSFVDAYCSADWESSGDDDLPCPGDEDENDGFVIRLEEPDQENRTENEPALWTNPEMEDDGWIMGTYPSIEIDNDDRFIADVGCLDDYEDCDVIFRLDYKIGNDPVKTLGEWHEVFDGSVTRVDVDLSDLDGEDVKFILVVTTNGAYDEDAAFWLQPHLLRED